MKRIVFLLLMLLALTALDVGAQAPAGAQSQKLETIPDTYADNEMAYLERFTVALTENPSSRAYIIAYSKSGMRPGSFLLKIYGYRDYLLNKGGIQSNRIEVVEGGVKDVLATELWLVPIGAKPPTADSEFNLIPQLPIVFDVVYPDCPPEMTVDLYELEDSLGFFARALLANPNVSAKIVAYPGGRSTLRKVAGVATRARTMLMRNYHINGKRIVTGARNRRRACSQVELWLTQTR